MGSFLPCARFLSTVAAIFLAVVVRGDEGGGLYNEGDDPNIIALTSVDEYETLVRPSPNIWAIQFYHPDSASCKKFAEAYRDLGRLMNGFFRLAVVDVSTEAGQSMFKSLKLYDARDSPEDPAVFTVTPKPFDNTESHPQQYMGILNDAPKLGQALLDLLAGLITERHQALGLTTGGGPRAKSRRDNSSTNAGVIEVNESNFDSLVLQNPNIVAVAFTAPWCGYCKQLRPEWEEAAQKLVGESITLAWIDATANQQLATVFEVQGYPAIKVFPAGAPKTAATSAVHNYEGPRDASGIVATLLQELDRAGVTKEIAELTDADTLEANCGGHNHICVLAALPQLLDSGAAGRNKYRDLLTEVSKSFRGTPFSFLWFEAGLQPDLEKRLELTFGAPALVAYSMDRQAYAVLRGSFTEKSITAFLHGITTGRQRTLPLQGARPTVVTNEPWDGSEAPPLEEEIPLSEIMGDDEF